MKEKTGVTKGAVITLPLPVLRRWVSSPSWASRIPVPPKQSSGHGSEPRMLGIHPNHCHHYLNDVCAKVESGQCKSGRGLLGCHIELTVSTSPVSCNPLNTIKFHLNLRSVGCPHCFFQSVTYIYSYPLLSCSQCANELK